jgi:hypothetical protein
MAFLVMEYSMGLDLPAIKFLRFVSKFGPFGNVATLGRQGLHLTPKEMKQVANGKSYGPFCEDFLIEKFGAASVESFDNSDYEQATHILDFNKPAAVTKQYDMVIDAGTMEHVYNAPQGLQTTSALCRDGGQILHMLPANNFCGHGFWQFSPELFFSLYSTANGYRDTQVFLVDVGESKFWYEVSEPKNGRWDDLTSPRALYAYVRTVKGKTVSHEQVQQSQYIYEWQHGHEHLGGRLDAIKSTIKDALRDGPLFPAARFLNRIVKNPDRVLRNNSNLTKRPLISLS